MRRALFGAVALGIAGFGCAPGDAAQLGSKRGGGSGGATFTENDPGNLVITAPARAAFIPETGDGQIDVTGTGATEALTIDGQHVIPADDGSFATTISASEGLNLIRAVDGDRAVDTPFLFGRFEPPTKPVPAAVALRVNERGFTASDPDNVSLTLLAQRALDDVDLFASLYDKQFTGDIPGGSWSFTVYGAYYGSASVALAPRGGGASFTASVSDIEVDGELTVEVFGVGPTGSVSLTADAADIAGSIEVGYDPAAQAIAAHAPAVTTTLDNFRYSSDNAGFPCCVDDIMTSILRPKVESAAQDNVKAALSSNVAFALSQLSMPSSLNLSGEGFAATIDVATSFDGAAFDNLGGTITAGVLFHHDIGPNDLGAAAPGWLSVSAPPDGLDTGPAFGISLSVDALNQALFAAWAQNGLERTFDNVPTAGSLVISPRLPPVVMANDAGNLVASAGEILMDATIGGNPVEAAITVSDELVISFDPDAHAIVLEPAPNPSISITWLAAEGLTDTLRKVIESQILETLPSLLSPITMPLPSMPLGSVASSFDGKIGKLAPSAALVVDRSARRAAIYGDLAIVGQ